MKRHTTLKPGKGFTAKGWTPKPAKTIEYQPRPRAPAVARQDGAARLVIPFPKPDPVKPGKRPPTTEERHWMDWIVRYGCVACRIDGRVRVQPAVHHILRGGQRIGHLFSLPLCDPGHHQNGAPMGVVSRHPWKARFEGQYGTELDLLDQLRKTYHHEMKKEADRARLVLVP